MRSQSSATSNWKRFEGFHVERVIGQRPNRVEQVPSLEGTDETGGAADPASHDDGSLEGYGELPPPRDDGRVLDYEAIIKTANAVSASELAAVPPLGLRREIEILWDDGLPPGERPGWPSLDRYYSVVPGQMTIITGYPGSGKSEWLDAVLLNIARRGWRHAIFSPENHPPELHLSKYLEKFLGKPFPAGPTERMTKDEAIEAATEMNDWFHFLLPSAITQKTSFNVEDILTAAEAHFRVKGWWGATNEVKKSVTIDPWNTLEHWRPREQSETEYVSWTLSRVQAWARSSGIHVFIVAHPAKPKREDGGALPVPRPDSISGSVHWWNKADCCVTVHRKFDDRQDVDIHIQKIRFKHVGRIGMVTLLYDRVTGRYHEQLHQVRGAAG